MVSPVDPSGASKPSRRPARPKKSAKAAAQTLPVPVGRAKTVPRTPRAGHESAFHAHVLGQEEQKRGLRVPGLVDVAKKLYASTEWSGAKDRRGGKGRKAKTDV